MSHQIDELYDVYEEHRRCARKVHHCSACADDIHPGALYYVISIVFDDRARTVKRCVRCQALHKHLRSKAPGEMWPDERLDCGTDYAEEWGQPPEWVEALAFWLPGEPLPAEVKP